MSYKAFYGQKFVKYSVYVPFRDVKVRRIGRLLAPNKDLAVAKARELWGKHHPVIMVDTPDEAHHRFKVMQALRTKIEKAEKEARERVASSGTVNKQPVITQRKRSLLPTLGLRKTGA